MELAPDQIGSTAAEFHGHFDKIATYLMNSVAMVINDKHYYRLVEIEFYLNGGKHPDVFTHSDKDQKTCGEWYFHKMNGSYKGGSYKGLDITFGRHDTCFGGILIRGIQLSNDPTAIIIEGPCLVVDQVLKRSAHPATVARLIQRWQSQRFWTRRQRVPSLVAEPHHLPRL